MIQRLLQSMILILHAATCNARRRGGIVENGGEVEAAGFPVIFPVVNSGFHVEHIDAANHFVHSAEAEFRHILPDLFGKEKEKIDDVLGLPLKLLSKLWILRRNADRTSIEMTLAHHDAAHGDERCRGETKFLCPEQRCNHNVAASLQFAVSLHADSAAEIVQQQNLLRLGQAKLPRNTGVLDRT